MKISASIYANSDHSLKELIQSLDDHAIDFFHIDCNDDVKVFSDIAEIRKYSNKPIDLHIISHQPEKYNELIEKYQPEFVTYQFEDLKSKISIPNGIKSRVGLSIASETDILVFDQYAERFDFIMFMATSPGYSGGAFNKNNFKKIRQFRNRYPDKGIHVDGGVNGETAFILRNLGADTVVSGSYLFKGQLSVALLNLKVNDIKSDYKLKDFMRGLDEIPALSEECSFSEVLNCFEEYKLGIVFFVDKSGLLTGIITNADLRRGLMANLEDLNNINIKSMMNYHPAVANENFTVVELLNFVKRQKFPISYLPVVDNNNKLKGALTFVNLIKGEL